jgi:hypothetical protein
MTPKEKAIELWLSYYELIDDCYSSKAAKGIAKQCALIVVDEIMKAVGWEKMELGVDRDNYWTEVKQEIEKL